MRRSGRHFDAIGRELSEPRFVHKDLDRAAARLHQVIHFERIAFGLGEDRLPGAGRLDADAAQPEEAVAGARAQPFGLPQRARAAANIVAPVTQKRPAGQRESGAPVAETLLQGVAQTTGPFVRRGVGIAELNHVQGRHLAVRAHADKLFEQRHQRALLIEGVFGRVLQRRIHALRRRHPRRDRYGGRCRSTPCRRRNGSLARSGR